MLKLLTFLHMCAIMEVVYMGELQSTTHIQTTIKIESSQIQMYLEMCAITPIFQEGGSLLFV